jgi:trk system potassium uptake protein TrkH
MKRHQTSDAGYLLGFFAIIILAGAALLLLPISWAGRSGYPEAIEAIDALFIATSAACVTGLSTVDTAAFSRFGQLVILSLIQVGGLGIISFTSLLLMVPGHRIPFRRLQTIRGFSVDGVEYDAVKIVRNIVLFTVLIESAGALALYRAFSAAGEADALYLGIFHSISAFCNAGFSPFPTSLESFSRDPAFLGIVAALIVTGGIGFIVLQDIERRLRGKRKRLSYHSRLVLGATAFLIAAGALAFWALERNGAYAGMSPAEQIANALFQAITPRTAGFDAVAQGTLSQPSRLLTVVLMFIGGAPGSIAGGVKVSTAFLVFLVMVKRADERGDINAFRRRLPGATTHAAVVYFVKAVFLLLVAVLLLSLSDGLRGAEMEKIVFETVSAFGTVGLSLGITAGLSAGGKLVIVATMFAGRVGLIALAFPGLARGADRIVYPEADVLLG